MRADILFFIIIIAFILAIDIPIYFLIKRKTQRLSKLIKVFTAIIFITIPLVLILMLWVMFANVKTTYTPELYVTFSNLLAVFLIIYIPKFVFIIFKVFDYVIDLFSAKKRSTLRQGNKVTRSEFMGTIGLAMAAIPFTSMIYGMAKGRYNFYIKRHSLSFSNLPAAFDKLKIIHISDIHLGNFNYEYDRLLEVADMINSCKPDLILFTGDLVNNFGSETKGWAHVFQKMNARIGKYSILGNHDYGNYSRWPSEAAKKQNFDIIKAAHQEFGFNLLLNENTQININNEAISLLGIENWGLPPFPQYGDFAKTKQNVPNDHFKILLSHDPTHWETEIRDNEDIDLTLSGHTHGMQMGIKWRDKRWSPAQWKYKYWDGLYKENNKYINVNRGLGIIGIPMRIGMPPEITLITINRDTQA